MFDWSQVFSVALLALGFGFVIFWHELGHFLAAKWAGVKVEQFAVGFGQALLAWRKGIGFRVGTTQPEYEKRVRAYAEDHRPGDGSELTEYQAAEALQLGETEYRLNWVPLGGYVKMLGQDDLNPNAVAEDPRAFNKQTIPKRMVIVSAGVVMNIILAAIGFMALFLIGFDAPPPIVGSIAPNSPATRTQRLDGTTAPIQVGDRILYLDDKYQHDFTKIMLNTALLDEGGKIPLYVQRRDGTREHLTITPAHLSEPKGVLMLGIGTPQSLNGLSEEPRKDLPLKEMVTPDQLAVGPGESIVAVNGVPVGTNDYFKLDDAVQASGGKPVPITIRGATGTLRQATLTPHFDSGPSGEPIQFAGMMPRVRIAAVEEKSPARGKLLPGDVVLSIESASSAVSNPGFQKFQDWMDIAGKDGKPLSFKVLRSGTEIVVRDIVPSVKLSNGKRGLSIAPATDDAHPVVAGVAEKSPAEGAGIPPNSTLLSINGHPVANWFEANQLLATTPAGKPLEVVVRTDAGGTSTLSLSLSADERATLSGNRLAIDLRLKEVSAPRKTSSPIVAAEWGAVETRDFILQFYLTIKRMVQGSLPHNQLMGPIGIFEAGMRFAYRGNDWLIWFLSMISANLAVVNFLPIPIVDGGLFTFLIIEKLRGKPLSPYAQQVAQFVGLALLLGVFVLVTYQDITRKF